MFKYFLHKKVSLLNISSDNFLRIADRNGHYAFPDGTKKKNSEWVAGSLFVKQPKHFEGIGDKSYIQKDSKLPTVPAMEYDTKPDIARKLRRKIEIILKRLATSKYGFLSGEAEIRLNMLDALRTARELLLTEQAYLSDAIVRVDVSLSYSIFDAQKICHYVLEMLDLEYPTTSSKEQKAIVDAPHLKTMTELSETQNLSKNIFIVHGHDDLPKLELARMLDRMGLNSIILSEQADKGRTLIEKLEDETLHIGYAFVILTPDDIGLSFEEYNKRVDEAMDEPIRLSRRYLQKMVNDRARQNVILELGYFVGKIGRSRVCCLYKGDIELPSDIHGVVYKKFTKSMDECYKGIVEELKAAGYQI